jgi:hypothetical protein
MMQKSSMPKTILKALACGLLIILLPFEFIIYGGFILIAALVHAAYRRKSRHQLLFIAIIVALVASALALPNQHDRKRFGPFPGRQATLAQLAAAHAVFVAPGHENDTLFLPSERPSKLEIFRAITNQTKLNARIYHCASGCNLLSGSYAGPIQLRGEK